MSKLHYGKIADLDIANGAGIRVSLFVSGCRNHCKNCFQPETWDFEYGTLFTEKTQEHIMELLSRPYIQGITLLGGEPMEPENQPVLVRLLCCIRGVYPDKDVWCYTGYTLEKLLNDKEHCRCRSTDDFLGMIDVLVEGRYMDELADITLKFRGSSNQRIIDMDKTRKAGRIILWKDGN